jgi:hypothetical protein
VSVVFHEGTVIRLPREDAWLLDEPRLSLQGIRPNSTLSRLQKIRLALYWDLILCVASDIAWIQEKYVTQNYSKFRGCYYCEVDDE